MTLFFVHEKLCVNLDRVDAILLSEHQDEVLLDIAGNQYDTKLRGREAMQALVSAMLDRTFKLPA